jgi:hypothetical protein
MLHKDIIGDDLHIARSRTGTGSPIGSVTPSVAGEIYTDLTSKIIYVASGLTNTSWTSVGSGTGGGGGSGDMTKSVYDTNSNGVVDQAAKLQTARTITLTGAVTGSASFDGTADVTLTTTGSGGGGGGSGDMLKSTYDTTANGIVDNSEKVGGVAYTVSATAPSSPATNDVWVDATNKQLKRWTGSAWDIIGGAGGTQVVYESLGSLPTANAGNRARTVLVTGATGAVEVDTLTITAGCTANGNVTVTLDGVAYLVALTTASQSTAALVATAIRAGTYIGWSTGGSGATVTFTATVNGARSAPAYAVGSTGAAGSVTATTTGVAGTADVSYTCVKKADDTYDWKAH